MLEDKNITRVLELASLSCFAVVVSDVSAFGA